MSVFAQIWGTTRKIWIKKVRVSSVNTTQWLRWQQIKMWQKTNTCWWFCWHVWPKTSDLSRFRITSTKTHHFDQLKAIHLQTCHLFERLLFDRIPMFLPLFYKKTDTVLQVQNYRCVKFQSVSMIDRFGAESQQSRSMTLAPLNHVRG